MQWQEITETPSFGAHKNFIICLGKGSGGKVPAALAQDLSSDSQNPVKAGLGSAHNLSAPVG